MSNFEPAVGCAKAVATQNRVRTRAAIRESHLEVSIVIFTNSIFRLVVGQLAGEARGVCVRFPWPPNDRCAGHPSANLRQPWACSWMAEARRWLADFGPESGT